MLHHLEKLPSWLILAIGLLLVAGLGVLDYLTGDYSLLIFYAIPVALEAWFLGRAGTVAISLASGLARLTSDYLTYTGNRFSYWNSFQDTAFLLMMGLLIAWVHQLLQEETPEPDQRHKEK